MIKASNAKKCVSLLIVDAKIYMSSSLNLRFVHNAMFTKKTDINSQFTFIGIIYALEVPLSTNR